MDGTYHFTIEYSAQPDQPPLRLIIYRPKRHPPATDCLTAVCGEEMFSRLRVKGTSARLIRRSKKASELLVVAWRGGSSKARGGDPLDPDCPPNAPCGVPLSSTADHSKLQLTMTQESERATLENDDSSDAVRRSQLSGRTFVR